MRDRTDAVLAANLAVEANPCLNYKRSNLPTHPTCRCPPPCPCPTPSTSSARVQTALRIRSHPSYLGALRPTIPIVHACCLLHRQLALVKSEHRHCTPAVPKALAASDGQLTSRNNAWMRAFALLAARLLHLTGSCLWCHRGRLRHEAPRRRLLPSNPNPNPIALTLTLTLTLTQGP